MTWYCPNCERAYPDSAIGVPDAADADEKDGCEVCIDTGTVAGNHQSFDGP